MSVTAANTARDRETLLADAPAAVSVNGVGKAFRLPHHRYSTLKERALHPFAARNHDVLRALDDVSFEVRDGEFFGIVGRNGSGKSTLLKCLAGIYALDSGTIGVRGRLSPFIELGVGFNPELTARDNVIINAIMLGLSRREAGERFDEIIAFAELEEFVDLKLKNYSSGMSVRLGFSVAVQVDADVLLVDEVLAVGDASFQQKCFDEFERMKSEGRTILFVTHDMGTVERFCDRAMVIERGRIVDIGRPDHVTRTYGQLNFGQEGGDLGTSSGGARITSAWCENGEGEQIVTQQQGEPCAACFEVEFLDDVEDPVLSVTFRNMPRHTIFVPERRASGRFAAGDRVTARLRFDNWLAPSRYSLTPSVWLPGERKRVLARRDDVASLIVTGRMSGGVADLPTELDVERA